MSEFVILVDSRDRPQGAAEKLAAHQAGRRHRAFSIFLVDAQGRLLLQRRHPAKYHSGGLWANACCGHPRPGERTAQAAQRRLREELGVSVPLQRGFLTRYHAWLANGLQENEVVHVFFGPCPNQLTPNPDEISALTRLSPSELEADLQRRPAAYAAWLHHYVTGHPRELRAGYAAGRDVNVHLSSVDERAR